MELLENKGNCSYIEFMTKDLKILNNSEVMPVVQLRDDFLPRLKAGVSHLGRSPLWEGS